MNVDVKAISTLIADRLRLVAVELVPLDVECAWPVYRATAIGCDWLWDAFPPATREKLARAALEKGLKTVRALPKNDFWRRGNTNWNTSCWYGATLASIVFHAYAPELTESLVEEAIAAFPLPVEFLAPEGCYPEGPSYWGSIVGYLYAIDALESALGSDFGLASVKVAENFNAMALDLGLPIWIKWLPLVLILAIGHGLNLAMAGLSVLVHAVRLNTLEFSNHKGVSWAGYAFRPFGRSDER